MVNMFEIVSYLCKMENISIAEMCRETGMRPSIITDLKHGRTKNLSHENMLKIANHFQVSMDVFNEGILEETYPNQTDTDSVVGYHSLNQKETPGANKNNIRASNKPVKISASKSTDERDKSKQKRSQDDATRLELANRLIDIYFDGIKYWSENKFLSSSEIICIKEYFTDLLSRYKEVVNTIANTTHSYKKYRDRLLRYAEKSGKIFSEVEMKERFYAKSIQKQLKSLDDWVKAMPNYLARRST